MFPSWHACMHAHDVFVSKLRQSCWFGFFVIAEEHTPMCLETEIKTGSNQTSNHHILQELSPQPASGNEEIKGHQNLAPPSFSSFWKSSTEGNYTPIALSSMLQMAPVPTVGLSGIELPVGQQWQEKRWHLPFPWEPAHPPD